MNTHTNLIVNGKVWMDGEFQNMDITIRDGSIHGFHSPDERPAAQAETVLDAKGCYVLPGGIDMHAHIQDGAETFFEGSLAALRGGITTVVDMPPFKSITTISQLNKRVEQADSQCVSDLAFTGGILLDESDLTHLEEVFHAGVTQFKIFMLSKPTDDFLWEAIQRSAQVGFRLTIHMEEPSLLSAVDWDDPLGFPKANPPSAENAAVARLLEMAHAAGAAVHVCHVSSARSAELIAKHKAWGTAVTAETTPHYLILNEEIFSVCPERAIVTPAIRTKRDNDLLWQALEEGVLDTLVSDHFLGALPDPSRPRPKPKDAEPGIAGLELSLPLIYDQGVCKGKLSMQRFIEAASQTPARLLHIQHKKGKIQAGMDADLVLFDPLKKWKVQDMGEQSRISTLPYENWELQGSVRATLVRGKVCWDDEKSLPEKGWGTFVPGNN